MKKTYLEYLVCTSCNSELSLEINEIDTLDNEKIKSGKLICKKCTKIFLIKDYIPRFVSEGYTKSFGFQWNFFKKVQIDRENRSIESKKRFEKETKYKFNWLNNKIILDAGSGAGRFLEYSSMSSKLVVAADMSNAIEASYKNFKNINNIFFIQADLNHLPFKNNFFDGCYSIGVIQHTPRPMETIGSITKKIKVGGVIALSIYQRKPWTLLNGKYLIRHLTKRLNKNFLLISLIVLMPILFPISQFLFTIPILGKFFSFFIPICDYSKVTGLNLKEKYNGVLLDTFDMLSPEFDNPMTMEEVKKSFDGKFGDFTHNKFTYAKSGINIVAIKKNE